MILKWDSSDSATDKAKYPHGYWYAQTDDGGYDGVGPDPLTAVCDLVVQIEREVLSK